MPVKTLPSQFVYGIFINEFFHSRNGIRFFEFDFQILRFEFEAILLTKFLGFSKLLFRKQNCPYIRAEMGNYDFENKIKIK